MDNNNIVSYPSGMAQIAVRIEDDTVWLTQKQMADLFGTSKQNISQHLHSVFNCDELNEHSVVKDFFTTADDGKRYQTTHYNLDAIISVGFRVNSKRGILFRQWATKVLRERIMMTIYGGRKIRVKSASLTYGGVNGDDPSAVRMCLESNIKRVLRLQDLAGVAAFVEENLAYEWLREVHTTPDAVRTMAWHGRLDCIARRWDYMPASPHHPLRMLGLLFVNSEAVLKEVNRKREAVYIIARDYSTGKEGYLQYRLVDNEIVDCELPKTWQMVFRTIQERKAARV